MASGAASGARQDRSRCVQGHSYPGTSGLRAGWKGRLYLKLGSRWLGHSTAGIEGTAEHSAHRSLGLNDVLALELLIARARHFHELQIHLLIVLAQTWSDRSDTARSRRELGRNVLHLQRAKLRVKHRDDCLARDKLRIRQHVGGAIYKSGRYAVFIHQIQDFARRFCGRPATQEFIEFLLVTATRVMAAVLRIVGKL